MSTPSVSFSHPMAIRWAFAGSATPALDVRTDATPPTLRGSIYVVGSRAVRPDGSTRITPDPEATEKHYRDQGITAQDVVRMTGADLLALTPLSEIRARSAVPEPSATPTRDNRSMRGTVTTVTVTLAQTTAPIPAEPP